MANEMVITSDMEAAREAGSQVLKVVVDRGYDEAASFAIRLAIEEALNNAIEHGNRFDPEKKVTVRFEVNTKRATITIADEGSGFDPSGVPDPTADENLEKPTGRGIMLMHAYMDKVRFNDRGNQVCLIKNKS